MQLSPFILKYLTCQIKKKYFHSNIRIENNVFETFDEPILYAKSVENLIYRNNTVIKNKDFKPFH